MYNIKLISDCGVIETFTANSLESAIRVQAYWENQQTFRGQSFDSVLVELA